MVRNTGFHAEYPNMPQGKPENRGYLDSKGRVSIYPVGDVRRDRHAPGYMAEYMRKRRAAKKKPA
jgi:hypothetical protein